MYQEDDLVPLSALQHVVYCPRRAALVHLEAAWGDTSATVEGSILHGRVHESGTESRGDIRIARGVRLRSVSLGVTGEADVVEFHKVGGPECLAQIGGGEATGIPLEGVAGIWKPYPVEYKVGKLRCERAYEVQLCGQAICLEEMLGVDVPAGAIYFGKTARRLEVAFDHRLRAETESAAKLLHSILSSGVTPKAGYGKRCPQCSLLEVCMPKVTGRVGRVKSYLSRAIRPPTEVDP